MRDTFEVPIGSFVVSAGGPTQVFTIKSPVADAGDVEDDDLEDSDAELEGAELLELEHDANTSGAMSAKPSARAITTTLRNW